MSEEFLNPEEMKSFNEERTRYLTELRESTEVYCKENKKKAEKRFDKYATDFYGYLLYCINETNKVEQLIEPSQEECEIIETERNDYVSDFKCSKCKTSFDLFRWINAPNTKVNYCPNCGAKIKREKKDE